MQPSSISSITHQDSPSPISSQNSTSGDDTSLYMRSQHQQQQHQKKKSIRNSLGRLFTRKPGSIDNKSMHESIHQPVPSYPSQYSSSSIARGKHNDMAEHEQTLLFDLASSVPADSIGPTDMNESTTGAWPSLGKTEFDRRIKKKYVEHRCLAIDSLLFNRSRHELLEDAIQNNRSFPTWDGATVVAWLEVCLVRRTVLAHLSIVHV